MKKKYATDYLLPNLMRGLSLGAALVATAACGHKRTNYAGPVTFSEELELLGTSDPSTPSDPSTTSNGYNQKNDPTLSQWIKNNFPKEALQMLIADIWNGQDFQSFEKDFSEILENCCKESTFYYELKYKVTRSLELTKKSVHDPKGDYRSRVYALYNIKNSISTYDIEEFAHVFVEKIIVDGVQMNEKIQSDQRDKCFIALKERLGHIISEFTKKTFKKCFAEATPQAVSKRKSSIVFANDNEAQPEGQTKRLKPKCANNEYNREHSQAQRQAKRPYDASFIPGTSSKRFASHSENKKLHPTYQGKLAENSPKDSLEATNLSARLAYLKLT